MDTVTLAGGLESLPYGCVGRGKLSVGAKPPPYGGSPHQSEDWFAMTETIKKSLPGGEARSRKYHCFTASVRPEARPTRPCISLGMISLVALPSATFCMASMAFSFRT